MNDNPTHESPNPPEATTPPSDADGRVLLVRRRRRPALGLWVLIALVAAFVAGLIVAWVGGARVLSQLLYFGATSVMLIGLPLALIAAIADAVIERRARRRGADDPLR